MSDISMKGLEMNHMLKNMSVMEDSAAGINIKTISDKKQNFSNILEQAIEQVNQLQQSSETMQSHYELGDKETSLAQVMVASQKANLSFQALLQVRNKLVSAYKEIMNMPV